MKKQWKRTLCAVLAAAYCVSAVGCAPAAVVQSSPISDTTVTLEETPVPLASRPVQTTIRVPNASGVTVYSGEGVDIDASNTSEGYVMVKCSAGGKVKMQLLGPNGVTYTYDLKGSGYEVFPLTSGSGSYSLKVFKNVSGDQYAQLFAKSITVALSNNQMPYLYPSQYVNYNASSKTVAKGAELAAGAADDLAVVQAVYNYVIGNITYDFDKATSVKSGYLPVVDSVLASGKGICFDYAAVMATMLRSQNIPTRLEVGYVSGGIYHAWVSVYLADVGWVNGIVYFDGTSWKLMDPTFASSGNSSTDIMQFIGNGGNYSTKYVY